MDKSLFELPHVVDSEKINYDLHDTLNRFKRSEFNYFAKDKEHGLVAGYWEAEDGFEDLGQDEFHEFIVVLQGRVYLQPEESTEEIIANPGDTVIVVSGRKVKLIVREPVKAFFICYPMNDIEDYERNIKK